MSFASVVGHARAVRLLQQGVRGRRVPQSLVLAGPEGVGKRAIAMALAQAVNCPRQQDGDACGTCPTCLRIARGQHADVTWIEQGDEASIKIRAIRDRLLASVGYRPFEAARRVYVIEPADAMTWEAQDALLKTLEEPPPAVVIVLVTAYPDTLLPTVQSRCRRLRIGPLTEDEVARVLVERLGRSREDARGLAAASGGSVARALAEAGGDLEDDREAALALLDAGRTRAVAPRLKAAAALAQHGSSRRDRAALGARLAIVQSLLRDLGVLASGSDAPLANGDLAETLRSLAPAYNVDRTYQAFLAAARAEQDLERQASPKIVADWLALEL